MQSYSKYKEYNYRNRKATPLKLHEHVFIIQPIATTKDQLDHFESFGALAVTSLRRSYASFCSQKAQPK